MCNAAGSAKEQNRLTVNAFIRSSGIFDGVIDWDAVMKDPADPTVIRAEWRTTVTTRTLSVIARWRTR